MLRSLCWHLSQRGEAGVFCDAIKRPTCNLSMYFISSMGDCRTMELSSMPRPAGIPDDIALRTGPMLLGNLFGYGLYGILVVQIFIYYHRFPRDPIRIKALVWFLFFVDTLITVLATITAWNLLGQGWGDPENLSPLDWPFGGIPLLSGLVASCVHFFFCWRIWRLRKIVIIPMVIAAVSLLSWAMASYCGIHGRSLGITRLNSLKPYVTVWLGGGTLVDLLITFSMVLIFLQASRDSPFTATHSLLHKLITLTIETGMITSIAAISELVLFQIFPNNNMHFIPFLMLAKLYSNTLLTTLNARSFLRQDHVDVGPMPLLWNDTSVSIPEWHVQSRRTTAIHTAQTVDPLVHSEFDMAVLKDSRSNSILRSPASSVHRVSNKGSGHA